MQATTLEINKRLSATRIHPNLPNRIYAYLIRTLGRWQYIQTTERRDRIEDKHSRR